MKKMKFYFFILLFINGHIASSQTFMFEQQILSSSDDAEEKYDGSDIITASSDIEMVYDSWNSQGLQKLGLRFDNITIPSNAIITNAYIQFTADGSSSGNVTMTIYGENVSNSSSFNDVPNNISIRPTTTSNVLWTPTSSWSDNQSGTAQRTPDLSTIVGDIIGSNGWQSGYPLTFIITGTGSSSDYRKAYSFDGSSSKSAKLVIEYTSGSDVDLAIISCNSPGNNIYPTPAATVQVEIKNYGNLNASNYSVSYSIDGNLIATEPGTVPLALGESTIFSFAQTTDLSAIATYNLSVELTIIDDENLVNNTFNKSISVLNEIDSLFFIQGSGWRYWDNNLNPGATWHTPGFNDASWGVGIGQFGFGEGDEQTSLNDNLISYYFRKNINIPDVNQLDEVYLHIIHDDGAIIYINGQEVVRSEMMPLGTINHTTTARQSINSAIENDFFTYKIDPSYLTTGNNTIAISLKNRSASDDDMSFDCYLTPNFLYEQDGPYVYYSGNNTIIEEVTPNGLVSNTYTSTDGIQLTCHLPHMGTSFSFPLKTQIITEPSIYTDTPSKFLTISDFDGHIEGFTMVLKGEGIIDDNFNWIYGDGHLIISGDLFDRGYNITECMWLLYKLEGEAEAQGGKVHLIIGNHEMMNMTDDWRYVELKYFNNSNLMGKRMLDLYDPNTELGRWLRSKNIIEKVGNYAFVHGGLSPEVADLNLTYDQINDYGRIEMNGTPCPNNDCSIVNGSDGVYWYRGMAEEDLTQQQVDEILDTFNVQRVIFGHTKDNTIRSLYNDRVLAIDMYHVYNFDNGYMEALQFELGCFYLFHTDDISQTYTQLGNCDEFSSNKLELNGVDQLQIYPNPTSNFLNIRIPASMLDDYTYTIIDQNGKQISEGKINSELSTIEVKDWTVGKYFITLQNSERTITGHFILSK